MADAQPRPHPRLASDILRNWVSFAIGAVVTAVAVIAYSAVVGEGFTVNVVIITSFVFWSAYAIAYLVLTSLTFRHADAPILASWLGSSTSPRALARLAAELSGSGPGATVQWSILAILSVALLSLSPKLLDDPLANSLSFVVVVSSWLVTIDAYAVHYARLDATQGGLQFPTSGDAPPAPVFMDYVYLAAQISTTFSSSDVSITTTLARRVVTGQTIIAFAFNTFIIAFLISAIFFSA